MARRNVLAAFGGILLLGSPVVLSGCAAQAFAGTWAITSGSESVSCEGEAPQMSTITGSFKMTASGNQIASTSSLSSSGGYSWTCSLDWTASGNVATLGSGQTCTFTANGEKDDVSLNSGTATLTDSTHMAIDYSASDVVTVGSESTTCTVAVTLTAQS